MGFFSGHVFAEKLWSVETQSPISIGAFPVGIGSFLELRSQDQSRQAYSAILLGELLNHDGSMHSMMLLNRDLREIEYIGGEYLTPTTPGYQTVLKLYEQQGGTCTGYAIDDFLLQTNLSGFQGTGVLQVELSTEEGRTELLADAIHQYYLVLHH